MLLSVGLIGTSTCWNQLFGFLEGAYNKGFPSSSTIYTASPLDEDWPLVSCSTISSVLYYSIVSTFHCLSHILSFSLFEIVPFGRECSRWRSLGPGHWFYELFTWYLLTVHLLSSKSIHIHKPCLLLLQIRTTKLYLTSLLIKKLNNNFCSPVVKVKMKVLSCVWFFATPWLLHPWDFPGKNTGMDCHFLLQGIFPTQGSNLGLPHCRQTLYSLESPGNIFTCGTSSLNLIYHYQRLFIFLSVFSVPDLNSHVFCFNNLQFHIIV